MNRLLIVAALAAMAGCEALMDATLDDDPRMQRQEYVPDGIVNVDAYAQGLCGPVYSLGMHWDRVIVSCYEESAQ